MALRTAHGNGAAALLRVETLPADELPALDASDTARGLAAAAARGRPFERGNRAASGRRPALASSAGMAADSTDPRYRKALGWARRYRQRRVRELKVAHGGEVSSGVAAMLTSSAIDMAASRFLSILAAETCDPALMKQASALAGASRQTELTALEIAAREAASRPKAPVDPLAAWSSDPPPARTVRVADVDQVEALTSAPAPAPAAEPS